MSLKSFIKKTLDDYKEYNKPENVKKRLKNKIEIQKLSLTSEKLTAEKKELMKKRYNIGGKENGIL